ncbi:MAG TPA: thiamine phosphate synthase [Polyangiaceae bacterium]|nr:thiamine phosphate synthase [Polyangiaceae bacterium]
MTATMRHAAAPRLVVITDSTLAPESVLERRIELLLSLSRPETVMVQLRDPALPVRQRFSFGRRLGELCDAHRQWFVVNDRLDLAVLLGADGVHLGERSACVKDARAVLPKGAFVSQASHSPGVHEDGVDAVLLSPIADARKGRPALGVRALWDARRHIGAALAPGRAPLLFALGGIRAENARECLDAGADGVAVVGAALDGRAVEPLLEALDILG